MTTISILAENTARGSGILGEHGLSFWIDTGSHRVLFDTGQGMALVNNAKRMGIDLSKADAIVLSHGHFDHVGGLEQVLAINPDAPLYLHPRAVERKYSGSSGSARRLSIDYVETSGFDTGNRRIIRTTQPAEVVPGVWCTGEIPRTNDFEDTGGPFYLDAELNRPDPLLDDQALFLPSSKGVSIILGCAHAGAVNTLRHVAQTTGDSRVRLLLGGLHLENAKRQRLDLTVEALRACRPASMGFCHCTGFHPLRRLWEEFPQACIQAPAGSRHELVD